MGVTHHITQAVAAAIYSCFFLFKTQYHGKALTKMMMMMMMKPLFKCHKILVHYSTNWGH